MLSLFGVSNVDCHVLLKYSAFISPAGPVVHFVIDLEKVILKLDGFCYSSWSDLKQDIL